MRTRSFLAMTIFLFGVSIPVYALPPQAEADMLMQEIGQSLAAKQFSGLHEKFERVVALKAKVPPNFEYHWGRTLFEIGRFELAVAHLDAYITKAGSGGKHYDDALQMYSKSKLELDKSRRIALEREAKIQLEKRAMPLMARFEEAAKSYSGTNYAARAEILGSLSEAAKLGYPPAQAKLGDILAFESYGIQGRQDEGVAMLQAVANRGHSIGQITYGTYLLIKKRYAEAIEMYKRSADQGDLEGEARMGYAMAEHGEDAGVRDSGKRAVERLCNQKKYPEACLWTSYFYGDFSIKADFREKYADMLSGKERLHWLCEALDAQYYAERNGGAYSSRLSGLKYRVELELDKQGFPANNANSGCIGK